jgi:hypothetical protein
VLSFKRYDCVLNKECFYKKEDVWYNIVYVKWGEMMKKVCMFLVVLFLVFVLSSCSIDSWRLSNEEEQAYLERFLEYFENEEYDSIYYFLYEDLSQNYVIEDGVKISGEDYIEDYHRLFVYQSMDSFYIMEERYNQLFRYYVDDFMYLNDVVEQTKEKYEVDSLIEFEEAHLEILTFLEALLDDVYYDKYVLGVDGHGSAWDNAELRFLFKEDYMIEDGIIGENDSISLYVEFDLEDRLSVVSFTYYGETMTQRIELDIGVDAILNMMPADLDDYILKEE